MPFNIIYDSQFTEKNPGGNFNSSPWNDSGSGLPTPLYAPAKEQLSNIPLGESRFDTPIDVRSVTDADYINQQRASNQSEWSKGLNSIAGGVVSGLLTAVEDTGYILDMENNIKRLAGIENVESNWLSEFAQEQKQNLSEVAPIYKQDPNAGWDWSDSASYWEALKGVVDSAVGFGIPGMGIAKGISASVKAARTLGYLGKLSMGGEGIINALGSGLVTNYAEGKMMSLQSYEASLENSKKSLYNNILGEYMQQVGELGKYTTPQEAADAADLEFQRQLASGKEEEFKQIAGHQADVMQRENMVFILSDALALHGIIKGSGLTRNLKELPKGVVKGMTTLSSDNLILQGAKEGVEEISQQVMQYEQEYQTAKKTGAEIPLENTPEDFTDRMIRFATDESSLVQGAMGFLGGGVQRVMMKGLSGQYGSGYKDSFNKQYQSQQEQIKANEDFLATKLASYKTADVLTKEAIEKGDLNSTEYIKGQQVNELIASNLDRGTTEALENQLDDIINTPAEEAKSQGFPDDYAQKAQGIKKQIKSMEKEWLKYSGYTQPVSIAMNRATRKANGDQLRVVENEKAKAKSNFMLMARPYQYDDKTGEVIPMDFSEEAFKNNKFVENKELNDKLVNLSEYKEYLTKEEQVGKFSNFIKQLDAQFTELTSPQRQKEDFEAGKKVKEILEKASKEKAIAEKKAKETAEKEARLESAKKKKEEAEAKRKEAKVVETIEEPIKEASGVSVDAFVKKETTIKETKVEEVRPLITEEEKIAKIADIEARKADAFNKINLDKETNTFVAISDEGLSTELLHNSRSEAGIIAQLEQKYGRELAELEAISIKEAVEEVNTDDKIGDILTNTEYTAESDASVEEESEGLEQVIAEAVGEKQSNPDGTFDYLYNRIIDGYNTIAYLSRNFLQSVQAKYKKGITLNRSDVDNVLNEGMLDKELLSDKKYPVGTKLTAKIDVDNSTMYIPGSVTKETTEWNTYVASRGAGFSDTDEYAGMVPIALYNAEGKKVAYLHTTDWMKEENIIGNIADNKKQLLAIRKAILAGGELELTISKRGTGILFRTFNNSKMPLAEGMPDKNLVLTIAKDNKLYTKRGEDGKFATEVVNKKLINGIMYAVVPMGNKHIAIPVNNISLSRKPEVINTVIKVLEAYSLWNRVPSRQEEFKALQQAVFDSTGLNISTPAGMDSYIKNFVNSFNTGKDSLQDYLTKHPEIKTTTHLFSINGGTISFGKGKLASKVKFFNQGSPINDIPQYLKALEEHLANMYANINLDLLEDSASKKVLIVNTDGSLSTQTYLDYIKNTTESNVISANIGTEENPEYTYFVQPVITFSSNVEEIKEVKPTEKSRLDIEKRRQDDLKHNIDVPETNYITGTNSAKEALVKFRSYLTDVMGWDKMPIGYNNKNLTLDYLGKEIKIPAEILQLGGGANVILGVDIKAVINAKYDAELAALESTTKETKVVEEAKFEGGLISNYDDLNVGDSFDIKYNWAEDYETLQIFAKSKDGKAWLIGKTKEEAKWENLKDFRGDTLRYTKPEEKAEPKKYIPKSKKIKKDGEGGEDNMPLPEVIIEGMKESAKEVYAADLGAKKQNAIVSFIKGYVLNKVFTSAKKDTLNQDELFEEVRQQYETIKSDALTDVAGLTEAGQLEDIADYQYLADEVDKILNNWDILTRITKEQIARINNVKVDLDDETSNVLQSEEDAKGETYGADRSFTMNVGNKLSAKVKQLLGNVKKVDKNGQVVLNYMNQEVVMDYSVVYNTLQAMTANYDPDFNVLMSVLEGYQDTYKWLPEVIDTLKRAELHIKDAFVTGMTNHSHNMKFIMYNRNKDGSFKMTLYDANANEAAEMIRSLWNNAFKSSDLFLPTLNDDGVLVFTGNKDVIIGTDEIPGHTVKMDQWIANADKTLPTKAEIQTWLNTMGITLTDNAIDALYNEKVNRKTIKEQFTDVAGIFRIINQNLKASVGTDLATNTLMADTIIKKLAEVQSRYLETLTSNSFRAGTKSVYTYGNNKFLVNEVRRLKQENKSTLNGKPVTTNTLMTQIATTSFNSASYFLKGDSNVKGALLLDELGNFVKADNGEFIVNTESPIFKNIGVGVTSLEPMKEMGAKSQNNAELHKQSLMKVEVFKLSLLHAKVADASGNNKRVITTTYPTNSDKTTVMLMQMAAFTASYDMQANLTNETMDRLYDVLVLPELNRIKVHQGLPKPANIKGYNDGADKFLLFPLFNNIPGLFDEDGKLNVNAHTSEFKEKFIKILKEDYINKLIEDKLNTWDKLGIGKTVASNTHPIVNNFIDADFLKANKVVDKEYLIKFAATDMVVQYLVSNAETFKLFIGDPALYWKHDRNTTDVVEQVKETFINIGKRLAADIAPGVEIADSMNNNYIQIFMQDHKSKSKQLELRLKKILPKSKLLSYGAGKSFDSTDAQEYTTWKEHLYILQKQGLLTEAEHKLATETLEAGKKLTYDMLGKVLQPLKPVFVGNATMAESDVRNRYYIKSSSFPLLPQLTKGLEIDKLRISMEELETKTNHTVRAAYLTAVKVGSISNPVKVWNDDGTIVSNLDLSNSYTILNRSGFRIQQDVPYDPTKDSISNVTQADKNSFINMSKISGFKLPNDDKDYTGAELQQLFNNTYGELYKIGLESLKKELLTPEGLVDVEKLRKLVKQEAIERNYSISDRLMIDIDPDLTFLPFSGIADKYSAVLNALVYNRVVKQKIHGKSFVLGSNEGFIGDKEKADEKISATDGIVFTSSWDKTKGIQTTREGADGKLLPTQVIVKWNFKDKEGKKLHIEDFVGKDGTIDFNKLPQELLMGFGMRIPNQGPNSQMAFEIVGFLPEASGDLIIASEDLVVQMGSDFDVDKLYTYLYNYEYDEKTNKLSANVKGIKEKLQNKLLDIHLSIHNNNVKGVQEQIASPLDTWVLEKEAKDISTWRNSRLVSAVPFTGLSDGYQTSKFMQATAGKSGVGVFSLDSMFNAIAQTLPVLRYKSTKENPFIVQYGKNKISRGELNRTTAMGDNTLYISEIISGYQSGAVDNEKLQILDKLNINNDTFAFIKIMNQLGFDEETFLTTSQDIIFDYIEELQRLRGTLGEYVPNAKELAYDNIVKQDKYAIDITDIDITEAKEKLVPFKLKRMIELGEKEPDFKLLQKVLLDEFIKLSNLAESLTALQTTINIDSKGFGKSIIESNLKEEAFWRLVDSPIEGATGLIGDIQQIDKVDIEEYKEKGYTIRLRDDGNYYAIFPTTIPGMAIVHGLFTNNDLWNSVYPTSDNKIKNTFYELENILGKGDGSFNAKSELRYDIWKELKSYLFTTDNVIVTNPNQRRRDLIQDESVTTDGIKVYTHKALGTIIAELKKNSVLKDNIFIKRLDISNESGKIIIKFNNSVREDLDETTLYIDFLDLFLKNKDLGTFNGEEYDTNRIASELVEYAYLTGGLQEAVQFTKLIPPSYLKATGFMEQIANLMDNEAEYLGLPSETVENLNYYDVSRYAQQYIQHSPEKVPTKLQGLDATDKKGTKNLNSVTNFVLTDSSVFIQYAGQDKPHSPIFISIRNSKLPEKYQLYKFNGESYDRISVLGIPFVSEYEFDSSNQKSVFNHNFSPSETRSIQMPPIVQNEAKVLPIQDKLTTFDKLGVKSNSDGKQGVIEILQGISKTNDYLGQLADEYLKVVDTIPLPFEVEVSDRQPGKFGSWKYEEGKGLLYFNSKAVDKYNEFEIREKIMHEITHALTSIELVKGTNKNVALLNNLHRQYQKYIKALPGYDEYLKTPKNELTQYQIAIFYSGENVREFVAQAMSSSELQELLNNIPDENTKGKRLWEQFKESVRKILSSLGIKVNPNSILASTLDSVMDLINKEEILSVNEEVNDDGYKDISLSINNFIQDEPTITKQDIEQLGKKQDGKVLEDLLPKGKTMKDLVEELKKKCK